MCYTDDATLLPSRLSNTLINKLNLIEYTQAKNKRMSTNRIKLAFNLPAAFFVVVVLCLFSMKRTKKKK